jgi:uncharacterized protein YndB with AHSA1/START domain
MYRLNGRAGRAMGGDVAESERENPARGVVRTVRELPFTRADVFRAFSDPTALAAWWGPEGFRNTFEEFVFESGGTWRFTMHAPDGTAIPNECRFETVDIPERIDFHHLGPVHEYRASFVFEDRGEQTLLTWRKVHALPEQGEELRQLIEPANEQNLDRLERHLHASQQRR